MRIAILEEDEEQIATLSYILSQIPLAEDNIVCTAFTSGHRMRSALRHETFDLVILDWNVSDMEGIEILKWLRNFQHSELPVMMLVPAGSEQDIAKALGCDADDCIAKPVRPLEFSARVSRLLRRTHRKSTESTQAFGNWIFNRTNNSVHIRDDRGDRNVVLTEREFRLALALFQHLGRPLSRAHLLEYSGVSGDEVVSRALDSHIYRLRGKLFLEAVNGIRLQTIYGHGYRLEMLARPPHVSPELSPASQAL